MLARTRRCKRFYQSGAGELADDPNERRKPKEKARAPLSRAGLPALTKCRTENEFQVAVAPEANEVSGTITGFHE